MAFLPAQILVDDHYQVCGWNRVLEKWTGISRKQAMKLNLLEAYPHLKTPRYFGRLRQVFETGSPAVYSETFHKHFLPIDINIKGETVQMIQRTHIRKLPGNQPLAFIAIEDLTKQYHQMLEIRNEMRQRVIIEEENREHSELLHLVSDLQSNYLTTGDSKQFFNHLIEKLSVYTNCQLGFIAEFSEENQEQGLQVRAISNRSPHSHVAKFLSRHENLQVVFGGKTEVFGQILRTKNAVHVAKPIDTTNSKKIPSGHPGIDNFLGMPLLYGDEVLGVVGLANAPAALEEELYEKLKPYLKSCAHLMHAMSLEEERKRNQQALKIRAE